MSSFSLLFLFFIRKLLIGIKISRHKWLPCVWKSLVRIRWQKRSQVVLIVSLFFERIHFRCLHTAVCGCCCFAGRCFYWCHQMRIDWNLNAHTHTLECFFCSFGQLGQVKRRKVIQTIFIWIPSNRRCLYYKGVCARVSIAWIGSHQDLCMQIRHTFVRRHLCIPKNKEEILNAWCVLTICLPLILINPTWLTR